MKRSSPILIAIAGSILTEGALIYFASRTGLSLQPFLGIVLIPALLLIYVGVGWLIKRFKLSQVAATSIRIVFWLIPIVWQLVEGYVSGTPKAMFERFVIRPMPPSTKDFEWQGGVGIDGFYNFAFKMDAEDTKMLIKSLQLEIDTNSMSLDQPELKQFIAGRVSWVNLPQKNIDSPILFHRTSPWRVELVTDTNYNQVYIFR